MATEESGILIEGTKYTVDDLTFREQRTMRDLIRSLAPEGDIDQSGDIDLLPAFITVVKQRTDPNYTVDQALEFKPADLTGPPTNGKAKK